MAAQLIAVIDVHGWTWRDLLQRLQNAPSHILAGEPLGAMAIILGGPLLGWLAVKSVQLRLRISPQFIECMNRLPAWAKVFQPDWRIERTARTSVTVDLRRASVSAQAAKIRFEGLVPRTIPLYGWYRLGEGVEDQLVGPQRGLVNKKLVEQLPSLSIIRSLKEAGIEPLIDDGPVVDPLRKSPAGWMLALSSIAAMTYALIAVTNQHDLYANQPPWIFIVATGGLAAYLAWEVVRRTNLGRDEKLMGVVATAAMFGLAAWAAAPRINAMTSNGVQDVTYRYEGKGIFVPERIDAPTLDLSRYVRSLEPWKPGDQVVLHLRKGVLGFWQYDRDLAITALDAKKPNQ